jgi:hypothetical protein
VYTCLHDTRNPTTPTLKFSGTFCLFARMLPVGMGRSKGHSKGHSMRSTWMAAPSSGDRRRLSIAKSFLGA